MCCFRDPSRRHRRLTPQDLERFGENSECGCYGVATWIDTYSEHPGAHATQLRRVARTLTDEVRVATAKTSSREVMSTTARIIE